MMTLSGSRRTAKIATLHVRSNDLEAVHTLRPRAVLVGTYSTSLRKPQLKTDRVIMRTVKDQAKAASDRFRPWMPR
jgi:hypothetical protein